MGKYRGYIAIAIGLLLLGLAAFFIYSSDSLNKEMFSFVILAFSLGLLSLLVIGRITGEGKMLGINIKSFSGGFAVFIIVILLFIFKSVKPPVPQDPRVEIFKTENPQDTAIWSIADGDFKWFNAPFGYASQKEHARTKFEWFKKPNFKLEILMYYSNDPLQNTNLFYPRFENLRSFLIHMKEISNENENKVSIENKIEVKVLKCENIPSISFFTTNRSTLNKPYSILYIFNGTTFRPTKCLTSFSKDLNTTLTAEFNNGFDTKDTSDILDLSVTKLFDKNIPIKEHSLDAFK